MFLFERKFGIYQQPVDVDESLISCPVCEHDTWADIMLISNYYHFYFVPVFPTSKEINSVCTVCGFKKNGIPFDQKHFKNYEEIKIKFKHPWYTYTGVGIFLFIILLAIILSTISS